MTIGGLLVNTYQKKPDWLKKQLSTDVDFFHTEQYLKKLQINTICVEAKCPNRWECWAERTATFLILGKFCTRDCLFCGTKHSSNGEAPIDETEKILEAIKIFNLDYVVITSVTRDDLEDGGASYFIKLMQEIKSFNKNIKIELLTPDFKGNLEAIKSILLTEPDVFAINIETVKSFYSLIRPASDYKRILDIIAFTREYKKDQIIKSSLIIGLGESFNEIINTLQDLKYAGCNIVAIGQYLQPTKKQVSVNRYYTPEEFAKLKDIGEELSLTIASSPFTRTSYKAKEVYEECIKNLKQF
jgi:lipoic acid synthetase